MKVIVGMPVCERAWVLPEWFKALEDQETEFSVLALYSHSEDDTLAILQDHGAEVLMDEEPPRRLIEIDGHMWGMPDRYEYMARLRNKLLYEVKVREADAFFSLDSDILLPPGGLDRLLQYLERYKGVVAPAVNMTTGKDVAWNTMRWVDRAHPLIGERTAAPPKAGAADIVMGAMLLDHQGMECWWSATGAGEDIGFCIDAEAKQVPRWWVDEVRCEHLLRRTG